MIIKNLGTRVASVWEGLRPVTKNLIVGALSTEKAATPAPQKRQFYYDAHADWELSSLLSALDEQSKTADVAKDAATRSEIEQLADTCVKLLEDQTASAEVFILLAGRALKDSDYNRLERLTDLLTERFAASEIAEVIRQSEAPQIRALASEALAMLPVQAIVPLLDDPLYAGTASGALEQKAYEFESDEARDFLDQFDGETDLSE